MKSDEDVRMISAEAPVLFAKACELFITEITLRCVRIAAFVISCDRSWHRKPDLLCDCHFHDPCRAWKYSVAEKSRRRTLQREDIQQAVQETDIFDFLRDVIGMPGEYKGHAGQLALQAQQSAQAQTKSKSDSDSVARSPSQGATARISARSGNLVNTGSPSPYGVAARSMHFQHPGAAASASAAALASSHMRGAPSGAANGNSTFTVTQHGDSTRTGTRTRKPKRDEEFE